MTTLEDLKKRATASELTLIAEVEKLCRVEARKEVISQFKNAIDDCGRPDRVDFPDWFNRMRDNFDRRIGL